MGWREIRSCLSYHGIWVNQIQVRGVLQYDNKKEKTKEIINDYNNNNNNNNGNNYNYSNTAVKEKEEKSVNKYQDPERETK